MMDVTVLVGDVRACQTSFQLSDRHLIGKPKANLGEQGGAVSEGGVAKGLMRLGVVVEAVMLEMEVVVKKKSA